MKEIAKPCKAVVMGLYLGQNHHKALCHNLICSIFSFLRMHKIMVHLIIDGILESMKYSGAEQMFLP